jgi:hypothetical protein
MCGPLTKAVLLLLQEDAVRLTEISAFRATLAQQGFGGLLPITGIRMRITATSIIKMQTFTGRMFQKITGAA